MPLQSATQSAVSTELESGSSIPADALKAWHQQYIAQDGGSIKPENAVIRAVQSDVLDYEQIEAEVQRLIPAAGVAGGFCAKCRTLLDNWPTLMCPDVRDCAVGRHFDTNEVEAAMRQGCRFCALLMSRLRHEKLIDTFRKIEIRLGSVGDGGTASLSITEPVELENKSQFLWLNLPGKVASHISEPAAMTVLLFSHILPPSVKLWEHPIDDPFEIARMWLARCSGSHECCPSKKQIRPPSRLISIGHGAVKLVVTASLPAPPRYTTLSYCWGSEPFTMLTQNNLALFLDHIPLNELPQTFLDAIDASRRLGVDYIWIDALCIIQKEEDNHDWENEAGHMSAVYGGTFVNLAASTATSVHEGFMQSSRPKYHDGGFIARVTSSDYCRVQNFLGGDPDEESITDTHLATRAWALQERLLSPRTIYFGKTGLFWACRAHTTSEFLPDGFPGLIGHDTALAVDVPWRWRKIVELYSKAKLTYSSDRLPALSGIASHQQQFTGGQYLAGMWRESLIMQLSWQMLHQKSRSRRPAWRAPTWSWASIDGEVGHFELEDCNEYIRVVDAWTSPCGPDPYGAVADGELTLSCAHLIRAQINTDGHVGVHCEDSGHIENEVEGVPFTFDCLGEVSDPSDGNLYLLPVIEGDTDSLEIVPETGEILHSKRMIQGLVLQQSSNHNGPKHLRRVGSFHVSSRMDEARDTGLYQVFMDVLGEEGSSITAAELSQTVPASEDQDGRLVIVIK